MSADLARLAYEASYAGTDPANYTPWDDLPDEGKALWDRVVQAVVGAPTVPKGWRLVPDRMFPIMGGPSIPWCVLEPCEQQAQENHGQSLKRLAERGGLDVGEAIAVLTGKRWRDIPKNPSTDELLRIVANRLRLAAYPPSDPAPERSSDQSTGGK